MNNEDILCSTAIHKGHRYDLIQMKPNVRSNSPISLLTTHTHTRCHIQLGTYTHKCMRVSFSQSIDNIYSRQRHWIIHCRANYHRFKLNSDNHVKVFSALTPYFFDHASCSGKCERSLARKYRVPWFSLSPSSTSAQVQIQHTIMRTHRHTHAYTHTALTVQVKVQ